MNKKTLYGIAAREAILSGVKKIAAAVKVTLGPAGRNVLISNSMVIDYGVHNLPIKVTKDGYEVTKAFEINDNPFEQSGVLMVKEAAQKTVYGAGDGTTTTVLLLEAIVEKGMEMVKLGANPMELKKEMDKAVEYVVSELEKMATPIAGDLGRIRQVATISANNDIEIGNWIAQAFEKIGFEGDVQLEQSKSVDTEIKITEGIKWNNGWVSHLFVTNKEKQIVEFENPFILLYEKRVTHHTQVQRALEISMQQGAPLLIVCEDADEEGLAFLAMNAYQKRAQCCVVKAPSFGNNRRLEMEDIAVLTGGTFITDSKGVGIKEIDINDFGRAKKVVVAKDETIIIGGEPDKLMLEELLNELRMNLAEAKNEDERSPIEKRLARITGSVAVIQVGAATETEMKEKLDRFDDAVRSVKAAIASGYIIGAGTAFLKIKSGNEIIDAALSEPLRQICLNAGDNEETAEYTIDEVREAEKDFGFNAKTATIENLLDTGIIDAAKVLISALVNASSSAGMILTSEVLICDTM